MTLSRKLNIIIHVSVAVIFCIMFGIWPDKKVGTLYAAVTPGLIASFLCFRLALPREKRINRGNEETKAADLAVGGIAEALNVEHKISALISLADHAHAETIRYREHVWKVVVWTVLLVWATRLGAQQGAMLEKISYLKYICASFAVLVTACGLRDVFFDYYWFVGNRNLQRKCERLLKFCEKDAYQKNESLLPERYQSEDYTLWDCVGHLIQWWFVIYAVSVYVIVSILWT